MSEKRTPFTTQSEWTFDLLEQYYNEIERIGKDYLELDIFPNQVEIISAEQMLDLYSSVGMPISYGHWSYGKDFVKNAKEYKRGHMGLAYEIVVNTSPALVYCMEENTMMMQILVMAHAAIGHNAFFKNNYLFKQWTDAEGIVDYLVFAKKYIVECEEKYGIDEVEEVIDSCHALQSYGVDKYKRPAKISNTKEEQRQKERNDYLQSQVDDLWRTVPQSKFTIDITDQKRFPSEPQENILYFIEKNAPNLPIWKREIIRIVRKTSQYFAPQRSTQVSNEGFATFTHYQIMHKLHEEGLVDDGYMLEFYASHTAVVRQLPFDHKYYSGINVYALGFAIYMDIKRMCEAPTVEDRLWFPNLVGKDWKKEVKYAMKNFKDDSFILQYLSPKVMRDLKFFAIEDKQLYNDYTVTAIHDEAGYKSLRIKLAKQYDLASREPNIQVFNVDRWGDRSLTLRHYMINEQHLDDKSTREVLRHVVKLWGFDVKLQSVDDSDTIRESFEILQVNH